MKQTKKTYFLQQSIVLLTAAGGLLLLAWMRYIDPRLSNWGSSLDEKTGSLPGDHWIPVPGDIRTRSVTIEAPPQSVWPWLLQLGSGRGGFYTFDWMEKFRTQDKSPMQHLNPKLQKLQLGDQVELAKGLALQVIGLETDHFLVLGSPDPDPHSWSWAFVLEGSASNTTRLHVRERYGKIKNRPLRLLNRLVGSLDNLMTWKMLRGIKSRAEKEYQAKK